MTTPTTPTPSTPTTPHTSSNELHGKTAVVTGSSRGIGKAIALELAAAGADLIIHARSPHQSALQVVAEIQEMGRRATLLAGDLLDGDFHEPLVEQAWQWRGGVDIWVNNAGGDVLTGERADHPFQRKLEYLWAVDVAATIQLARLAGAKMKRMAKTPGEFIILNMGWDQAEYGMGGDSGEMFTAVKGAVMAFSKSLAKSLAPIVRVNCLAPGWIQTQWGESASPYWRRRAENESLLGRWGQPDDVARVARFLASPAAAFINGQVIPINGGFHTAADPATNSLPIEFR